MAELSRASGIAYFHFLQPNQYVPGSKPISAEEAQKAISGEEDYKFRTAVELGYPLLAAAGERLAADGLEFIDLRFMFRDHPEPLYVDTCCHLGLDGNDLLGEEIGRQVGKRLGSLPGPEARGRRARPDAVSPAAVRREPLGRPAGTFSRPGA